MTDYIVNMSESQVQTHFNLSFDYPSSDLRIKGLKDHMISYDHVSIIAVHRLSNYLCDIDDLF